MMTSAGIGMWLSALALQYRDVQYGLSISSRLLMYLAPVVWPMSLVTEKFGYSVTLICSVYPLVGVIEGFRAALLGTRPMPWDMIAIGGATSLVLFISGAFLFRRMESRVADVA
jgi:lipopolysaccharide transport system permease protein